MNEPTKARMSSADPSGFRAIRFLRRTAGAGGLFCILAGLTADLFGFGRGGFGRTQVLLILAGATALLIAALGRRFRRVYTDTALVVVNTALLLALVELSASATRYVLRGSFRDSNAGRQLSENVSYYADRTWSASFWSEQRAVDRQQRYVPFVLWHAAPFEGRYITIDEEGFRVSPGADCRNGAFRVFVFGGSAVWGIGSPDSATIPAAIQRQLSGSVSPLCVRNLGQNAFVSSQDVLELLRLLQKGEVPDRVIFYNGFNDVYAAALYGQADGHLNLDGIAHRFEGSGRADRRPIIQMIERSQTWLLAREIMRSGDARSRQPIPAVAAPTTDSLAGAVVDTWVANYHMATALAREYGFEVAFYWQPFLAVGNKRLTAEERLMVDDRARVVPLGREVYQRIQALSPELPRMQYLGDIFDADTALVWIDMVHVTPEANERVAHRMIDGLVPWEYLSDHERRRP